MNEHNFRNSKELWYTVRIHNDRKVLDYFYSKKLSDYVLDNNSKWVLSYVPTVDNDEDITEWYDQSLNGEVYTELELLEGNIIKKVPNELFKLLFSKDYTARKMGELLLKKKEGLV